MLRKLAAMVAVTLMALSMAVPAAAQSAPATAKTPSAPSSLPTSAVDQTKVPHYFGPYSNWANSPLTLPDATVVITGDGTGATADATVGANGAVTAIAITNTGSGYTAAAVNITGAGTGATANAVVTLSGAVTGVTIGAAGGGYTAPTVTFANGGATTQATGHVLGGVDAVNLSVTGVGYSFPTVDFDLPDDPNGVQATGHAVCGAPYPDCNRGTDTATMTVVSVVVDTPGSGYFTAPNVVIRDGTVFDPINPPTNFVAATGTATLSVLGVALDTFGAGYLTAPTVTIADSATGAGAGATASASIDTGTVSALNLTAGGSGYITPGGMKKFVDTLPGLTPAGVNNLGQYIPVAQADTTTFANADYYVIAVVQHREKMSSNLDPTLLREYVQLSTAVVPGKHVALMQDNLTGPSTPILMPDGSQAYGVDDPHYLGPTIVANKDRADRIVFYDLLPTGVDGNLFLPTDTSLMGSGETDTAPVMPTDPNGTGTVLDAIRNPMCTVNPQMADCYTQNRATLHLHGGVTPWISDGTPHQWITPAGDSTAYPQGVSVQNVPDMVGATAPAGVPDCTAATDGCMTFYYTNEQSARLMFYHDHAWGITRLNVYAGEAAGYVLTDPTEQKLISSTGPMAGLGLGTPLVIQDKTFVPSAAQLLGQDPTWDASKWGGMGNLWYQHVYMPAQNPASPNGMSAYGRWFYGPWFWPPATPQNGAIANPYYQMDPKGPDGIMGAPGSAAAADDFTTQLTTPCALDNPATWQYQVEPFCEPPTIPGTPNLSVGMEQFNDTPLVNGTAYPTTTVDPKTYRFRVLNASNDRAWNLSWYVADNQTPGLDTEVALNASELAAAQTDPNIVPTPDTTRSPAGPSWIQIGDEGGFLPAPTVVKPQPTTWIIDPTRFDVGNVDKHSLVLMPAERGDVIVDFSKYAGKTLILYNDAPAAYPGRVATYDYYTGMPDLGAGQVIPGYGPNTRTVMQVRVAAATPAPAFNLTALNNAFKHHADGSGVFESSQDPIIVGQAGYNSAYGTSFVASGDCTSQTATNKCDGFARISQQGGQTFRFDTLKGPQVKVKIEPKALHDEMNSAAFDEFGRMTSNLGLEVVPATPAGQNILLYPYIAPPTEIIDGTNLPVGDIKVQAISSGADGTQIWKITHNGVDTHPIHFHLFNVQLINRVTWDNIIIPPEASELGWKETVRTSPLEDTIVAVRPITPTLPFEVPNSIRLLDPQMPAGVNLDPQGLILDPNGNVTTVTNALVNFGWEYVYHCHILSHEEMDMMRPVLYALPPLKADTLTFDSLTKTLGWNDNSITETSFDAQVSGDGGVTWTTFGSIQSPLDQPNIHQPRSLVYAAFDSSKIYMFRVVANNAVGALDSATTGFAGMTVKSVSATLTAGTPTTPTLTTSGTPSVFGQNVTFTATLAPTAATGTVTFLDGATVLGTGTLTAGVATFAISTLAIGTHPIVATYGGDAIYSNSTSNTVNQVVTLVPTTTTVAGLPNPPVYGQNVTFTATVAPAAATGTVTFSEGATTLGTGTLAAGATTFAISTLTAGSHTITATYGGDATYATSFGTTTFTVTQALLYVIPSSPSMVFGAAVPAITPTYQGLVNGDTAPATPATCTTTATSTSPVGPYPTTCSGAADPNYFIAAWPIPTFLTITPAGLTITASSGTMVFGGTVPVITPAYVGLTGGNLAPATPPTCTTLATSTSPVGSYASSCTGAVDPNYTITYVPGTVTVTAATLHITASGGTMMYGGVVPAVTPIYVGLTGGNVAPATPPTCTTTATSTSAVGTYPTTCSGAVDANYTITYTAGSIVISKATTTTALTSNHNPSVHGQAVTFTATVTRPAGSVGVAMTGNVQFTFGGVLRATVAINAAGVATYSPTLGLLTTATHPVVATYVGDARYAASTGSLTQTVTAAATTTTLTLVSTVSRRNTIRYTARVTAVAPGTGTATGTVRFYKNTTLIGSATLAGGVATLNYRNTGQSTGTFAMHAVYVGVANFSTSTSPNVSQRITL